MPVPEPVLYPAFNTLRISHIEYGVADLNVSKKFYSDILGLQVTDENNDTVYLRAMEERGHHCVILKKSSCLLYTSPSPRDATLSRMPSSA